MTGDITRLPPPQRADRRAEMKAFAERIMPAAFLHLAARTLTEMEARWKCQAFAESDRAELESALEFMAMAEHVLNNRLSAGMD